MPTFARSMWVVLAVAVVTLVLHPAAVRAQGEQPTPPPGGGGAGPIDEDTNVLIAVMAPTSSATTGVSGWVQIAKSTATTAEATVTWDLSGLPAGDHGFHIHELGDLSKADGTSAGGHFNPSNVAHNCPPTEPRHAGDMGSITVDANGKSSNSAGVKYKLDLAGINSIVGRAIVIHRDKDTCTGTSGNAGPRLAVGVLGLKNPGSATAANNAKWGPVDIPSADAPAAATCKLVGVSNAGSPGVSGLVTFIPVSNTRTRVFVSDIANLPAGSHGFHIHTYGDISDPAAGGQVGGHYNPEGKDHGLPSEDGSTPRHVGDMGNLVGDAAGTALYDAVLDIPFSGNNNILGRAVIIHAGEDTGVQPTGGAGSKLAQCVIGLAAESSVPSTSANPTRAVAHVLGVQNSGIRGVVTFLESRGTPAETKTAVTIDFKGLTAGASYALHIHANADLSAGSTDVSIGDGSGMGGHFNPLSESHGCPGTSSEWHVGDVATITADASGRVVGQTLTLAAGTSADRHPKLKDAQSIIGRGIVVHEGADGCQADTKFGAKAAIGVIARADEANNDAQGDTALTSGSAVLRPVGTSSVKAQVYTFTRTQNVVRVYIKASGLPGGEQRAVGLYDAGELASATSLDVPTIGSIGGVGSVWTLSGSTTRVGDLGYLIADKTGNAVLDVQIVVPTGMSVLGRAIGISSSSTSRDTKTFLAVGVIGSTTKTEGADTAPVDPPADIKWGPTRGSASSVRPVTLVMFVGLALTALFL